MKILNFSNSFPPRKGGIPEYSLSLSTLLKKNNAVRIVACDTEETGRLSEEINGLKVMRLKCYKLFGYFFITKREKERLKSVVTSEHFDLVITNMRFFILSFLGGKFAKKRNIHWIHIEHGSSFVKTNNPLVWLGSRIYDYTIGKWIFNNADKVICVSEESKRFVKRISNIDAIVLKNAVNTNNIKRAVIKKEVKNIIFVGRLIYAKGIQDLINAFSKIDNGSLTLTIIGDGPYKKDLEQLVKKLKLTRKVIFTGEKSNNEVLNLLAKSDLFVNPSYSEGLPTSVLEAGAVGLPVIATDVGGTREVVIPHKTGLLTKEKSLEQLRQAIGFMINNRKERSTYAKNLHNLVKTKFNWRTTIKQWEKIIK